MGLSGAITGHWFLSSPLSLPPLSISGQYEVERNIGKGRGERGGTLQWIGLTDFGRSLVRRQWDGGLRPDGAPRSLDVTYFERD